MSCVYNNGTEYLITSDIIEIVRLVGDHVRLAREAEIAFNIRQPGRTVRRGAVKHMNKYKQTGVFQKIY